MQNITTEILINRINVDLFKDERIDLIFSIADIKNISNRNSSYSKQITLPATAANSKLFSFLFDVGVDTTFNPNIKAECIVVVDSIEVINGYVQLTDIVYDISSQVAGYKVVIFGNNFSFIKALGEEKIMDLDWSDFTHAKNQTNIEASFFGDRSYVYPLIDVGAGWQYPQIQAGGPEYIDYNDLKPAFYVKDIVNKMFSAHSFTYTSEFLSSPFFSKLLYFPPALTGRSLEADVELNLNLHFPIFNYSGFIYINDLVDITGTVKVISQNPNTLEKYELIKEPFFIPNTNGHLSASTISISRQARILLNANDNVYVEIEAYVSSLFTQNVPFPFYLSVLPSSASTDGLLIKYLDSTNVVSDSFVGTSGYNIPMETFHNVVSTKRGIFDLITSPYYVINNSWNSGTNEHKVNTSVIYNHIPENLTQVSFFNDIIKLFNLYIDVDKASNGQNLIIEPRQRNPFSQGYYDLSNEIWEFDKLFDASKEINIRLLSELQNKNILFSFQDDSDYLNQKYKSDTNEIYSQKLIELENDFLTGTMEIKPANFAGTPSQQIPGSNGLLIPRIYNRQDNINSNIVEPEPASGYKGRLLYFHGNWDVYFINGETIQIKYETGQTGVYSSIAFANEFYGPTPWYPSMQINYGVPREVFYQTPYPGFSGNPQENLYTTFYEDYISGITDKNSKLVTAYFNLSASDISKISFNDLVLWNEQYWYFNKIEYNAQGNETTKVELLLMTSAARSLKDNKFIGKRLRSTPTITGKGNNVGNFSGAFGRNNNSENSLTTLFQGDNNNVGDQSNNVFVSGNNNTIGGRINNVSLINANYNSAHTSNTVIINGTGNTVNSGLTNTIILNLNDFTVPSANTVYMGLTNFVSGFTVNNEAYNQYWTASTGNRSLVRYPQSGNTASATDGIILAGTGSTTVGNWGLIGNGHNNILNDFYNQTILNGNNNSGYSHHTFIVGGDNNIIGTNKNNSAIIGLSSFSATSGNTLYVPALVAKNLSGSTTRYVVADNEGRLSASTLSYGFTGITSAVNLHPSNQIYSSQSGSSLYFRGLSAGTGIALTQTTSAITITNTVTAPFVPSNTVKCQSANYIATNDDWVIVVKNITASTTVTLPAAPLDGKEIIVKDASGLANTYNITIQDTVNGIDGGTTYVMINNYQSTSLIYSDCHKLWLIVYDYIPVSA